MSLQGLNCLLYMQPPSRQNCRKRNVEEYIFDYMASHIECRFNKISLLQCYVLAILPAGLTIIGGFRDSQHSRAKTQIGKISTEIGIIFTDIGEIGIIRYNDVYTKYLGSAPA